MKKEKTIVINHIEKIDGLIKIKGYIDDREKIDIDMEICEKDIISEAIIWGYLQGNLKEEMNIDYLVDLYIQEHIGELIKAV